MSTLFDTDRRAWNRNQYFGLPRAKRVAAVVALSAAIPGEVWEEVRQRITENPQSWIHGRKQAVCFFCDGAGTIQRLHPDALADLKAQQKNPGVIAQEDLDREDEARKDPEKLLPPERCPSCRGAKVCPEPGMHFGWGMGVRNLLRREGFGEQALGVGNLDDYYVALLEAAAFGESYHYDYITEEETEKMRGKGWEKLGNTWCQTNGACVQAEQGGEWWQRDLKEVRGW